MKKISIPIKLVLTLISGMLSLTLFSIQWFPAAYLPASITPTSLDQTTPTVTLNPSPMPTATPTVIEPFVNLSNLLMVDVEFYPDAQPLVLSVKPLEQGRVTPGGAGETKFVVLDSGGMPVYDISINPVFVFGEPAKKHDSVRMSFIIPNPGQGARIQISSEEWTMEYKIDGN
jgi:hypothetical protein